jgi:hypothetical protein
MAVVEKCTVGCSGIALCDDRGVECVETDALKHFRIFRLRQILLADPGLIVSTIVWELLASLRSCASRMDE